MDVKCWIFFALVCVNFHVSHGTPDSGMLYRMFEELRHDVQSAISSTWNALRMTGNLSEIIVRYEFFKMKSLLFGSQFSVTGDQEDCNRMETTLRSMSNEAMEFGKILENSTFALAPYLEDIVVCDTKTPALWLQCVLRATKQATAIIVDTRDQIVQFLGVFKNLTTDLTQECEACERTY